MVDPIDLPEGINETNINVRVSVPEDAILKNFNPKEVKVTRIIGPRNRPKKLKKNRMRIRMKSRFQRNC